MLRSVLAMTLATVAVAPVSAGGAPRTVFVANSTCYAESGLMADGTRTRDRSVAMNNLPFGSVIKLVGSQTFYGRRVFTVRDRIGAYSQMDFWHPSNSTCNKWGRRNVRYIVVKRGNGRRG